MAENMYTATLDGGEGTETLELELIQGQPQKTITRSTEVDGEQVEEIWQLDPDAPDYTYRPGGYEGRDYS
ncbi:MAG: hypothetical protein JWR33_2057 [Naasia sp.]|jgi:hypothetical protein|uniref:hypothetical protein n=1 Tax=Naasia sp. TaxID=2546198 RepID=UPI0026361A5B|nr:hypothetical protein [Naasia sp.]MCU1571316.1 hypothetical protein [Naasia sp.]